MRQILVISSLVVLASACGSAGDDKATPAQETIAPRSEPLTTQPTSLYVTTAADLPVCSPESQGHLVYIESEKSFRSCLANEWKPVDVKGAAGAQGAAGKDGEAGEAGKSEAVDYAVDCEHSAAGTTGRTFHYKVMVYTSGDRMIFASVQDISHRMTQGSSQIYGAYFGFNSRFARAGGNLAKTGEISVDWLAAGDVGYTAEFQYDGDKNEARAVIGGNSSQPYLLTCSKE